MKDPVFYHLIVTDDCNLCCRYCRAKAFEEGRHDPLEGEIDYDLPLDLSIDPDLLYRFLARDPDPVLTFYGGEPLLRADLVAEIVLHAPVKRFMIQTNGILLPSLPPEIANRFELIHLSIDGPEPVTDRYRGTGTYRTVIRNAKRLVEKGFRGELNARMTVAEVTDICEAVTFLAHNPDFPFSSIHWQLDANFSNDSSRRQFREWVETSYNPGIRELIRIWLRRMQKEGRVLKWYPFLDTMEDLLLGRPSRLRCGAGYADYTILTDGSIVPCPAMVGMKEYYLGHIATSSPHALPEIAIEGECLTCGIRTFCGGRCLYSNIVKPWGPEEREIVCGTVRNLYETLTAVLPDVRELIGTGRISMGDFFHTKFNGCEIIP
jgi:putative peptide-modifying radical SAM enzyme